ncbi:hypothetical protein BEH94_08435 [Candidatus Altiarchaeales archaeon WOR_SM1_SCG]|nr:hypothetical protein BEH94_08435 [Candidatus Altiarchaeales archaeon WOR_SM1_SCG]
MYNEDLTFPRIMEKKVYMGLAPKDQEEYVERKIEDIVKINSNGITISDIFNNTPFTRPTVIKHLEKMVSSRKAYKIRRGKQIFVYYPNGRPVHPEYRIEKKSIENEINFRGTFLNNNYGKFVFLESLNQGNISGGSMLIRRSDIQSFFEFIKEVIEKDKKLKSISRGDYYEG